MDHRDVARVTIFRNPVLTTRVFGVIVVEGVLSVLRYVTRHVIQCGTVAAIVAGLVGAFRNPPAGLEGVRDVIDDHGSFMLYWIVLGVLSSIGLGSGLHTFVLFLGPHILRVANAAVLHGNTAYSGAIASYFKWPRSWDVPGLSEAFSPNYEQDAWDSHAPRDPAGPAFLSIAAKIAWPSFLWGLGTALGELPPYFVARAAAASGRSLEELEEVEALEEKRRARAAAAALGSPAKAGAAGAPASEGAADDPLASSSTKPLPPGTSSPSSSSGAGRSLLEGAKVAVFESIQRYGFTAILLAASIPNPLFDLAGITCGHFGIPFATFFGATLLGKALVKPSIQAASLIAVVRYGPWAFDALRGALPHGSALARAVTHVERSLLAGQHAMCTREADCAGCCGANFAHLGQAACLESCAAGGSSGGSNSSSSSGSGGGGGASWLAGAGKAAWGWVLVGMIGYFLLSIVHALVRERMLADLEAAEVAQAEAQAEGGEEGEGGEDEGVPLSSSSSGQLRVSSGSRATPGSQPRTMSKSQIVTGTPGVRLRAGSGASGVGSSGGGLHPIRATSLIDALAHASELSRSAIAGQRSASGTNALSALDANKHGGGSAPGPAAGVAAHVAGVDSARPENDTVDADAPGESTPRARTPTSGRKARRVA